MKIIKPTNKSLRGHKVAVAIPLIFLLLISFSAFARKDTASAGLQVSALPPLCETLTEIDPAKCKALSLISRFGCDDVGPGESYWGGLSPHLPTAVCYKRLKNKTEPYITESGCKAPMGEQIIVLVQEGKKTNTVLIKDREGIKRFFAPIENSKEAMSYVSLMTGAYPKYDFPKTFYIRDLNENGNYASGKQLPTEVKEKKEGFEVRLFDHPRCGCHRPFLSEINYFVTRAGDIREIKKTKIWEADRQYRICID